MRNFIIEQSPSEIYTSAAGLTLIGQCLNKHRPLPQSARSLPKLLDEASVAFLQSVQAPVTTLDTGQVALDVDVFSQDNGGTKKEDAGPKQVQRVPGAESRWPDRTVGNNG